MPRTIKPSVEALEVRKLTCLLELSYKDITGKDGLIDFTKRVRERGQYGFSKKDLETLFSNKVWREIKTKSGHRKIEHKITHTVIDYPNHHSEVSPGTINSLLIKIQEHINTFFGKILGYKRDHEHTAAPDYKMTAEEFIKSKRTL